MSANRHAQPDNIAAEPAAVPPPDEPEPRETADTDRVDALPPPDRRTAARYGSASMASSASST